MRQVGIAQFSIMRVSATKNGASCDFVASNDQHCGAANFISERDDLNVYQVSMNGSGVGPFRSRGTSTLLATIGRRTWLWES
jgi:hypothetical protein